MRKLKRVRINIMREQTFIRFSPIMMIGTTYLDDDTPTACTNGRDEWYGRAFVQSLSDKELAFVVLHENLHKALRHMTTWSKLRAIDARLTNMALDFVINLMLVKMDPNEKFLAEPLLNGRRFICLDTRFEGMNTKQVFDILKQEKEEGDEGDEGDEGSLDEHDWDGARELSAAEKEVLEKEIDRARRQGEAQHRKLFGRNGGNIHRELGDLLDPQIDWKAALEEFVSSTCAGKDVSSWKRINRRFISQGTYMPSFISERVGSIVVGIDTSGSIGNAMLALFLSEVAAVAGEVQPEKLDLIYWDAAVAGHEEYDVASLPNLYSSTKPVGGGGTDPSCVEKFLEEKAITPDCIIMLTDGRLGNWGANWSAPVLWVILNNPDCYAPNGKTIHID